MNKSLVQNLIAPADAESVQEVLSAALQGREVEDFCLPLRTRYGEKREILLNVTPRRGPHGDVLGVVGVGQDITELNIQRRAIENIAGDLRRLIDTANAPIFGTDFRGRITEWNRKTAELSGYSWEEIRGQGLAQTLVTEDCQ